MPHHEDLVARAHAAEERVQLLCVEAARVTSLARLLREARAGRTLLHHCAWCGIRIGDEWLELEAIGSGRTRIAEEQVRHATNSICPDCFERVSGEAEASRSGDAGLLRS